MLFVKNQLYIFMLQICYKNSSHIYVFYVVVIVVLDLSVSKKSVYLTLKSKNVC